MPYDLERLVWNVIAFAALTGTVWMLAQTGYLRRRSALVHGLWLLVLLKLVTPSVAPVPILAALDPQQDVAPRPTSGFASDTEVDDSHLAVERDVVEHDPTAARQSRAEAKDAEDPFLLTDEQLLARLKSRDLAFQKRYLDVEQRWSEHINPRNSVKKMAFHSFKLGDQHTDFPRPADLPEPYDQLHRRRCRLTVRDTDVIFDVFAEQEKIRQPFGDKIRFGNFRGCRLYSVDGTVKTTLANSEFGKDFDRPFALNSQLRWHQHAVEWCCGYGLAGWMTNIESTEVKNGLLVVSGTAEVFEHAVSTVEMELDRNLIMRRCVVSTPSSSGNESTVKYIAENVGTKVLKNAPPVSLAGSFKRIHLKKDRPPFVYRQRRYYFVGLSDALTDEQYIAVSRVPNDLDWKRKNEPIAREAATVLIRLVKDLEAVAVKNKDEATRQQARDALDKLGYSVWFEHKVFPTGTYIGVLPVAR